MTTGSEPNEDRNYQWISAAQEERRASVARFNERRNIEWKLALTLWGGFGLVANALRSITFDFRERITLTVMAVVVVCIHGIWVATFVVKGAVPNWREGRALTDVIRVAMDLTEDGLDIEREEEDYRPAVGHWMLVLFTLAMALFVIAIIWNPIIP